MEQANAPEKIYLEKIYPDSGVLPNGLNYNQSPNDIEYIRADVFIKKAVIWISNNCYIPHSTLENFKKYIEG